MLAREHFVEHATESPNIRAAIHGLAFRLLGRHVGRSAQNNSGLSGHASDSGRILDVSGSNVAFDGFGQTKVQNFYVAVGSDFYVGGFQIAVNDPAVVS